MIPPKDEEDAALVALIFGGAFIGLGKLLASGEKFTWQKALGHSIVSGGLAVAAALIAIPLPNIPFYALMGVGAALASLGASTITAILQRYIEKKLP